MILFFAHIIKALYKASRAEKVPRSIDIESECDEIKQQLLVPRVIRLPDSDRSFILETGGSRVAIGAVLKQRFDDTNLENPVQFISKA